MTRCLLALLLFTAFSCGADSPVSTGASFRFETARLELGTMHQYEEKAFVLPFKIEGSGSVRVDVLDTSCGCTDVRLVVDGKTLLQAEKAAHGGATPVKPEDDAGLSASAGPEKIELAAGTRGEVRGTYRPEQRQNDQVVTVTVSGSMLNSPTKSQIHAFVKPAFVVAIDAGNFGTLRESVLRSGEIVREVTVQAPAAFQVKFWKGVPANLRIEAVADSVTPAPDGDGVLQKLRLCLQPNTAVGTEQMDLIAETSLGPAPLIIRASWRVLGPVTYAPEQHVLFLNKVNDRDHDFSVKIRPTIPEYAVPKPQAEILGDAAGHLVARVEELPESNQGPAGWVVRVTLPKGTPAGAYTGSLRISYSDPSGIAAKELTVSARVQEPR